MNLWGIKLSLPWTDKNEPAPCMYQGGDGDDACEIIVAPDRGYRTCGMVFCSDKHAALDQQTAVM